MCTTSLFFSFLLFYFFLLIFFTIYRKDVGYKGIFYVFVIFLFIFTGYVTFLFNKVILFSHITEFLWIFNNTNWLFIEVAIALRLDGLSYLFVLLVLIIGLGTNLYILNYIKFEAHEDIFVLLINWFMFSMVLLVLANNLFTLFLGWESIGLSSFFLINFWNTRRGTVKSSFKAFFFNKISDVFLFIFLVTIHYLIYTNNLCILNLKINCALLPSGMSYQVTAICLFFCTLFKSAQLIGHLWLPDSMEAPVPASALIHSATLVSAGVYLLLRFTPLITLNNLQLWALIIGSFTAAFGGVVSASQTDMKKLLAYSTISHCGFLFVAIGTEVYVTVIIYLFLHGLFKALTFFCSGSFIRVAGSQDTRQMGALNRLLPVDTIFLIICSFNLGGLPFSLGYLYKSMLITSILNTNIIPVVLGLCSIGLLSSIVYVYRLVYYSAFDISKEFFTSLVYELQQKQINIVSYWSLTTYIQILTILMLLTFTGWIYIYFINYFVLSELTLDHFPILLDSNTQLSVFSNLFFKSYYELLYIVYILIIFILLLIVWRYEYSYQYKLNILLTFSISLMFAIIYSIFLNIMWGQILTEASTQQNFNFGFSTYKSEILVHLSQWQYWWWFWFSLWWALYYFIILRTMTKRTFNFNITMNTSVRGRGKWGDFLVALIPVTWCCNILINSNFILRMIEWQNESSLFTIRIQGKQWYWVYKYDPNTAQAIISTPKNIGHNRWRVYAGQESYNADTYYQAIHLAAHLEFQESYSKFTEKIDMSKKTLNKLSLSNDKLIIPTTWRVSESRGELDTDEKVLNTLDQVILENSPRIRTGSNIKPLLDNTTPDLLTTVLANIWDNNIKTEIRPNPYATFAFNTNESMLDIFEQVLTENSPRIRTGSNIKPLSDNTTPDLQTTLTDIWDENIKAEFRPNPHTTGCLNLTMVDSYYANTDDFINALLSKYNETNKSYFNAYYDFLQLDETVDVDSNNRHNLSTQPFRLMRGVLNQHVGDILQSDKFVNTKLTKPLLFSTKYTQSGEALRDKELLPETLWGFRQKKYKRVKKFKFKPDVIYDPVTFEVVGQKQLPTSPRIDIAGINLQNIETRNNGKLDNTNTSFKDKERSLEDNFNYRLSSRISRHRSELVPVTLARRLLRTKRTLVLPAHVNLTVITNSYDVVHSWFVPGLGLKLDCVPGRSTHHTFYVDNIGFYYGQCAEICGRYHHHMPIRLCAIPFDHFVVWWQSKGLARLNRTGEIKRNRFLDKNFSNPITREKLIYQAR